MPSESTFLPSQEFMDQHNPEHQTVSSGFPTMSQETSDFVNQDTNVGFDTSWPANDLYNDASWAALNDYTFLPPLTNGGSGADDFSNLFDDFLNDDAFEDNGQISQAGPGNPCQATFAPSFSESGAISASANDIPFSEATQDSRENHQAAAECDTSARETSLTSFNQSTTPWPAPATSAIDMAPHHQKSALSNESNNPKHSIDSSIHNIASNTINNDTDNNASNGVSDHAMPRINMTADHVAPHLSRALFEDPMVRDMVAQIDFGLRNGQYDTVLFVTNGRPYNHLHYGLWSLVDVFKTRMHHPGFVARIGWAIDAFAKGEPNEKKKPHDETIQQLGTELEQAKREKTEANKQLGEQLKLAKLEKTKADKRYDQAQTEIDNLRSKLQEAKKENEDGEKKLKTREQQMLQGAKSVKEGFDRLRAERDHYRNLSVTQKNMVDTHVQRQIQLQLQQLQQKCQELESEANHSNKLIAQHAEHAIALQKKNQTLQAAVDMLGKLTRQGPPPVLSTQGVLSRFQDQKGQPNTRNAASHGSPQMAATSPTRPASMTTSGADDQLALGQASVSNPYQRLIPDQIFSRRIPAQAQANLNPSSNGTLPSAPGANQTLTQTSQPMNGTPMQCQTQTRAPTFPGVSASPTVQAAAAYQAHSQANLNTKTQSSAAHGAYPGSYYTAPVTTYNASLQAPTSEASAKNRCSIDLTEEDSDAGLHSHGSGVQSQQNLPSSPHTVGYATPPPSRRGSGHPAPQTSVSSQSNTPTPARKAMPDWVASRNPQLTGASIPNPMLPEQGKKQQVGAKRGREELNGEAAPRPSAKKARTGDVANSEPDAQKKPAKKAVEKAPKERAPKAPKKSKVEKEMDKLIYKSFPSYLEQMDAFAEHKGFNQHVMSKEEWLAWRAAEQEKATSQRTAPASRQQHTSPSSSQMNKPATSQPATSQHGIEMADQRREAEDEKRLAELADQIHAAMTTPDDEPSQALPEQTAQQPDVDEDWEKSSLFDEDETTTYDQQQESEESEEE
ncbi:MAG: hypothetical protein Q9174_000459 [Haloplaca sp. 1 TL-2023]